jgi:hypothetical protein
MNEVTQLESLFWKGDGIKSITVNFVSITVLIGIKFPWLG